MKLLNRKSSINLQIGESFDEIDDEDEVYDEKQTFSLFFFLFSDFINRFSIQKADAFSDKFIVLIV